MVPSRRDGDRGPDRRGRSWTFSNRSAKHPLTGSLREPPLPLPGGEEAAPEERRRQGGRFLSPGQGERWPEGPVRGCFGDRASSSGGMRHPPRPHATLFSRGAAPSASRGAMKPAYQSTNWMTPPSCMSE